MNLESTIVYTHIDLLSGRCKRHDFFTFQISRCEAGLKLSMNRHQFSWPSLKYVRCIDPSRDEN